MKIIISPSEGKKLNILQNKQEKYKKQQKYNLRGSILELK